MVAVHGTVKLEIRNWKFGLHAFVLLMNAFNSPQFLLSNFKFQAVNGYDYFNLGNFVL
jgi:hypothetical protein